MPRSPADSRSLTCLQDFLNLVKNRPKLSDIPSLPEPLLLRTRNSRRHAPNNNDLLEFLGDRCVNLATALLVDAVRVNKDHHMAVRRVICNNDTFGRLSFHLHLHEHAALDAPDRAELDKWNPLSTDSPPKVLADLFEAYAGAVYLQHGWKKLFRWLRALFEPIVKVATRDFWYRDLPRGIESWHVNSGGEVKAHLQSKFLDYLGFKGDFLAEKGRALRSALPADTGFVFSQEGMLQEPHCDEIEVAAHLVCMWICKTFMRLWPRYHQATAKAPHLATVSQCSHVMYAM
ncbi:hypothetical protein DENSPDRAFT_824273 [Dentipellis sp. KUC8613]|nr:hypothetical protein DENSPDRAFT_824273 [Dentipellis sp. KUC8613]